MAKSKWNCVGLILLALVLGAVPVWGAAAKYPAKAVTFVAPSGAGGAFDKLSKLDSWRKELDKRGWDADYKSGDAFTKTLDQQHKDIGDLLKTLDMAK